MSITRHILPLFITLSVPGYCYADIYQCKNDKGFISYKDTECLAGEYLVNRQMEEINIIHKDVETELSNCSILNRHVMHGVSFTKNQVGSL